MPSDRLHRYLSSREATSAPEIFVYQEVTYQHAIERYGAQAAVISSISCGVI